MQIDAPSLMPGMQSTNSAPTGSHMLNKEMRFQNELDAAQKKLNKSAKVGVMTEEDIAQRNKDIHDASVQLEAIF